MAKKSQIDESSPGLKIWRTVEDSDADFNRPGNDGRRSFTTVDPHFQLKRATAMWGPYGDQWGITNVSFNVLVSKEPASKRGEARETSVMLMTGHFFYPNPNPKIDSPISFEYAVDRAFKPGWDVCKFLQTNFRSKCLSLLGFNADVYLGMWDDCDYVRGQEIKYGDQEKTMEEAMVRIADASTDDDLARLDTFIANMTVHEQLPYESLDELREAVVARRKERNTEKRNAE